VKIQVKVRPSLRSEGISREGGNFVVNVRERSQEGKATPAAAESAAEYFGVPQRQVRIVSSFRGKNNVIEVGGDYLEGGVS